MTSRSLPSSRTETELVLKSRWVQPRALLDSGFRFAHPDLRPTLSRIVAAPRADRSAA